MSVPICFGSKLIQLAISTRSMQGSMFTVVLDFVVLLPLTQASQLACYFLIAGRVDETSLGFWAVFVAVLAQMLPCIMLYVFLCFNQLFLTHSDAGFPNGVQCSAWSLPFLLVYLRSALFWKDWYSVHCEDIIIIHLSFTFPHHPPHIFLFFDHSKSSSISIRGGTSLSEWLVW